MVQDHVNIFYLSHRTDLCAQYHVDRHVIKMILEYAQILSTAHRVLDGTKVGRSWVLPDSRDESLYKATHFNHPSCVWARSSVGNYQWLSDLALALCDEYRHRYGAEKRHKTETVLALLAKRLPDNIPNGPFTDPTPALTEDLKDLPSMEAYRIYYARDKRSLHSWKNRETPDWIGEHDADLQVPRH